MDPKNITGFDDEPDWFKEFMASSEEDLDILDSDTEVIPPVTDEGSHIGDADIFVDEEMEKILRETLEKEFPVDFIPDEPIEQTKPTEPDEESEPMAESAEENLEEKPIEEENTHVRKVRPRKKNGYGLFGIPHIAATLIWLVLAVGIGVSMGRLLWRCATDVLAFGRVDQTIFVTITDNDNIDSITQKLFDAGLIDYPGLFKIYAQLSNAEESISSGTFELNRLYDYHALVGGMSATSSYRQSVKVVIPEGYSCAQIYKLLEDKGVCTVGKLEEYSATSEFADYWFLEGVTRGSRYTLEGFLFPDTYEFYTNSTPKQVFIKFLNRFDDQLDDNIEEHIATLNERLSKALRKNGCSQEYIDSHQLTLYDIINIASMLEKESAHTGEHYDVSSVIFNRLSNPIKYPKLQIDATIVYALGGKQDLTEEDMALDSPYNTYLYDGLTPTPISNPGKSSILAALRPAETTYLYYALDPSINEHHFSTTYEEHKEFLESLK